MGAPDSPQGQPSQKRGRLEIIHDILRVIERGGGQAKPTQILYRANLSNQMLYDYLAELVAKGMAEQRIGKTGRRTYSITRKGEEYLQGYHSMRAFMDSYGIS